MTRSTCTVEIGAIGDETITYTFKNRKSYKVNLQMPFERTTIEGACQFLDKFHPFDFDRSAVRALNNAVKVFTHEELEDLMNTFYNINILAYKVYDWLVNEASHHCIQMEDFCKLDRAAYFLCTSENPLHFLRARVCSDNYHRYQTLLRIVWSRSKVTWRKILLLKSSKDHGSILQQFDTRFPDLIPEFIQDKKHLLHDYRKSTDTFSSAVSNVAQKTLHLSPSLFQIAAFKKIAYDIHQTQVPWVQIMPLMSFRKAINSIGKTFQIPGITRVVSGKKAIIGVQKPAIPYITKEDDYVQHPELVKETLSIYLSKLSDIEALNIFHTCLSNILTKVTYIELSNIPRCFSKCVPLQYLNSFHANVREIRCSITNTLMTMQMKKKSNIVVDGRCFKLYSTEHGGDNIYTSYLIKNKLFINENHEQSMGVNFRASFSSETVDFTDLSLFFRKSFR